MSDKKAQKNAGEYFCNFCNFKCSKYSDYTRHLLTAKHKRMTNDDAKNAVNNDTTNGYKCDCGKMYRYRQGLHQHKKKCTFSPMKDEEREHIDKDEDIVASLVKQNVELQQIIINNSEEQQKRDEKHIKDIEKLTKQISELSTITNNTTHNTTNNNKFNLNFFLNTQCKDAMSIQSFMENLAIGSKELEHMGDVGYLNGMIDIFNNTIGNMDVYKRPLHCTDLKREVLYFKQGNEWERDSEDKQHLKKLIKNVETKNYYNLQDWQKDHPGSLQCDTPDNNKYLKIATEALGGADTNKDSMYLTKIMKHIVKEVHVKP
jgi:hypothetical protein